MDLKWQPGGNPLGPQGLPQRVEGLEELLQNVRLGLCLPRGSFLYGPGLGSGLHELDPQEENSPQRAWALAGEALLGFSGVAVGAPQWLGEQGVWRFPVETPLGAGTVDVPGKEAADGNL